MTGWRPEEGWNNPNEHLYEGQAPNNIEIMLKVEKTKAFEAGADTMHIADVQWMRDRLKMTADGFIEILCTQADWQHFSRR